MAFWTCPNCGRKVPGYSAQCHCGVARTASMALPVGPVRGPVRFSWAELPWPVWAALGVVVLAFGIGVWRLLWPGPPERIVPVLGVIERIPSPTPRPTPKPSSPRPSTPGPR